MKPNYTRYRSVLALRTGLKTFAGRNSIGQITIRHRGKGHKQAFRSIDWTRTNEKAVVVGFEYDPQRSASLAKLYHNSTANSTQFSYILAPSGMKLFQEVYSYNKIKQVNKLLQPGDSAPLSFFETGDFIHGVEAFPGQGAIFGRSAGSFCQVRSLSQEITALPINPATDFDKCTHQPKHFVKVRLPSGSQRLISFSSRATLGVVGSKEVSIKNFGKAGRIRWLGWRPSVRGVARNPVDHPHGGGQGKTSGGRPSVTFKSWLTKGQPIRNKKRRNIFILIPRSK